jgi:dihydroxy-acid dehydratase
MLRILPALMESRGWNKIYPVITDGRLPDSPAGLFISLVSPESFVKSPMAVLKAGDEIEVNIVRGQLLVRLTDTDLRVRLARWVSPEQKTKRNFLDRYSRSVSDVFEGAILK